MRATIGALLLGLLAIPVSHAGESPAARYFAELAGHWRGSGTVNGHAADIRMTWEPVLDGRFQQLTLDNRIALADGKEWHFKARAFYRIEDDGSVTGHWFDSRGISLPLKGSVDGDRLLTIGWGDESTERGRSSYQLTPGGLEVIDELMESDGRFVAFGRTTLKRPP